MVIRNYQCIICNKFHFSYERADTCCNHVQTWCKCYVCGQRHFTEDKADECCQQKKENK